METIELTGVEGIARLRGLDADNRTWVQFTTEHEKGECCICGATLIGGWHCLDGGDEVCPEHVVYFS